ncbi:MAG: phasin family protein [Erysipelotrichaceae bacterium]|nr:phasin family protein [Erysipelotrichaceae bacterium]MDY5251916.1 phasin family protein [Erysipelotrichaceae bacterium]
MSDLSTEFKKVLLAGVGAIAITAEKSQQLIEDLVKKGEITVEQGKALNAELRRNINNKLKETSNTNETSVDEIVQSIHRLSAEEKAILMATIKEIDDNDHENIQLD